MQKLEASVDGSQRDCQKGTRGVVQKEVQMEIRKEIQKGTLMGFPKEPQMVDQRLIVVERGRERSLKSSGLLQDLKGLKRLELLEQLQM